MITTEDKLIIIIQQKGSCDTVLCTKISDEENCPFKEENCDRMNGTRYKTAIDIYLETHSKEDLLEVLL